MRLDIDGDVAAALAAGVMLEDYKNLMEDEFFEETKCTKAELLHAYTLVLDYCTTEAQRLRANVISL